CLRGHPTENQFKIIVACVEAKYYLENPTWIPLICGKILLKANGQPKVSSFGKQKRWKQTTENPKLWRT
ncbi:MAG: hypothetical protein ACI32C_05540, partial [Candidatus Enteromonas sp.]